MEDLANRKDFTVHDNIFVNAMCELLGGSPTPGSQEVMAGVEAELGAGRDGAGKRMGTCSHLCSPALVG